MTDPTAASTLAEALVSALAGVIRGKRETLELLVVGLLAEGHVLIEDVPGVGKTTLAKALARALSVRMARVQFTPDLLPSDIVSAQVLDPQTGTFSFHPGPVFTHVLLADEINRASPRTQSALLEAMSEGQFTVDGTYHPLARPFVVLATQNPVEYQGTYCPKLNSTASSYASSWVIPRLMRSWGSSTISSERIRCWTSSPSPTATR